VNRGGAGLVIRKNLLAGASDEFEHHLGEFRFVSIESEGFSGTVTIQSVRLF
jgi:hypothetical protein